MTLNIFVVPLEGLGLGRKEYQPGDGFCIGYDEKIERKIVVVIEVSNVP